MSLPRIPIDPRGRELWQMLARDQFGRGLTKEVDALLLDAFRDVVRRILVDGPRLTVRQNDRLAELFRATSALLAERYGQVSNTVTAKLGEFSAIEAAIARQEVALRVGAIGGLSAELRGPGAGQVIAIAEVLLEGQRLPQWWQEQARKMSQEVRRQIQVGLTLGESTRDIVKRIVPPRGSMEPSAYRRAQREATTLVRTATTAASNQARFEELRRMDPRISDSYRWLAVRDARTSEICRALDGQVFRYDDPKAPVPPAHFQCRSTIQPVIKRAALGIGEPSESGPGGWRDYEAWLKSRTPSEQDEILGKGAAKLWRAGRMTLRQMVDADGRALTLTQLRTLAGETDNSTLPVHVATHLRPDARMAPLTEEVAAMVAQVHRAPPIMRPVSVTAGRAHPSENGAYLYLERRIELKGSRGQNAGTYLHELGHALDHGAFAAADPRPAPARGLATWFFSERPADSPAWKKLWAAIDQTAHVKTWKDPAIPRDARDYMLSRVELFARAYHRWVYDRLPADAAGRQILRDDLERRVARGMLWSEHDFREVAEAMDLVFKEMGWRL